MKPISPLTVLRDKIESISDPMLKRLHYEPTLEEDKLKILKAISNAMRRRRYDAMWSVLIGHSNADKIDIWFPANFIRLLNHKIERPRLLGNSIIHMEFGVDVSMYMTGRSFRPFLLKGF